MSDCGNRIPELTFEGRPLSEMSKEELIHAMGALYSLYQRTLEDHAQTIKTWQMFTDHRRGA